MIDDYVTISPLTPQDAEAHLAGEDELLARWLNGGPGTRATVDAHIARSIELWRQGGPSFSFGVRVGAERTLAGTVDVQFGESFLGPGQANIAYGVYPAWRRQGVASRAVMLALAFAAERGATEAVIRVHPENHASRAVARRCGFTTTGETIDDNGDPVEVLVRNLHAA